LGLKQIRRTAQFLASADPFDRMVWTETRLEACWWRARAATTPSRGRADSFKRRAVWARGSLSEIRWWREWLDTPASDWWRALVTNPASEVEDPLLAAEGAALGCDGLSLLDVGAGPASRVGVQLGGTPVRVTAIDPLARSYRRLLRRLAISPVVPVASGSGERLLGRFPQESFDIAYACNALDHACDPMEVIRQMYTLVRPGGRVVLRHYVNEAEGGHDSGGYDGLHQWNFEVRDGELVIWNREGRAALGDHLPPSADISVAQEPSSSFGGFEWSDWVTCVVRKP
jgi:SAM-dependent methyltransferase